ncbi:Wzz/FepE/Etk N-terminal domain-containing protein, partial [Synechococcus sp. AH-551-C10]
MTRSDIPPNTIENPSTYGEINLRHISRALLRHKLLIGAFAGSALVLSTLHAFNQKPVWEGQFQIVLRDNQKSSSASAISALLQSGTGLANLISGGNRKSQLQTEVRILESPSVLKPVFDFVKASKAKTGADVSEWRYKSWVEGNLKIELAYGTSVLEIAYRDTEKDLILPVIDRISNAYQTYSDRDRTLGLDNAVSYLKTQIKKLNAEANSSMRAAQNFGLNNDLGITDGLGAFALAKASSSGSSKGLSVESNRNAAQNKVNALEQTLNEAEASSGTRVFVAPQIDPRSRLYTQLQDVEARLQEKLSLLTPNDPSIRALQRQRQSLTSVINNQTVGLLKGKIQTAQAELESFSRPHEVILKHRELVSKALRDEQILAEL